MTSNGIQGRHQTLAESFSSCSTWRMGTRHVRTLFDLAISGHHLKALCQGCGHKKIFDGNRLWWLYQRKGWDTSIKAIAAHLRCSECGGKRIVTSMTFEEPTGPQPMGPSDREWKEHVRRQRR